MTAILTPHDSNLVSLHFSAGGKDIDADKAVVTVTFSPNLKTVLVDPGYVGTVEVDSHVLRAHELVADEPTLNPAPTPVPPAAPAPPAITSTSSHVDSTSLAAAPPVVTASPSPAPTPTAGPDADAAPFAPVNVITGIGPSLASQLLPSSSADTAPATPRYQGIHDIASNDVNSLKKPMKLYWSEPVTGPDGTAPPIALDELKLVELQGSVTVVLPTGESKIGTEGLVFPSGSTVRTSDNSSVAIFMGGVNSARLMPRCELVITQSYAGSLRSDIIDLHRGAVFSRIGHRDGETENYSVRTPEGTSHGESRDMLAYRGTPSDLRDSTATTRAGLLLNPDQLLAWNPAPTHGLISDVAQAALGIQTPIGWIPETYFYYTANLLNFSANQIRSQVFTNVSPNASSPSASEPDYVLQAIMLTLQPFNRKLNGLLNQINAGTETSAQLTYYHNLVTVFFDNQAPTLVNDLIKRPKNFYNELNVDSAMLYQDLREFNMPALTPR